MFGNKIKDIALYNCQTDIGYFIYDGDKVVDFLYEDTERRQIELSYCIYNATDSGTYILKCRNLRDCAMIIEEKEI